MGYVTSATEYSSGDTDGVFDSANNLFVKEFTGSYNATPNPASYVLPEVPAGLVRITWRTEVENFAGANNNTVWLYIDNVKVRIKSN